MIDLLTPLIKSRPDSAILVIGHGTDHPVWTAYLALENLLRERFGSRIFVSVVEKSPSSQGITEKILRSRYSSVFIMPFFLVAGMHYRRDIVGRGKDSWNSRLRQKGLAVETFDQGLGMLPGFCDLVVRHIEEAIHAHKK
jgi:sirohydrochlorin cobaltochelatase